MDDYCRYKLTLTEAGARVGKSAERIRQILVQHPDIGRRYGWRWRIDPDALDALLKQRGAR